MEYIVKPFNNKYDELKDRLDSIEIPSESEVFDKVLGKSLIEGIELLDTLKDIREELTSCMKEEFPKVEIEEYLLNDRDSEIDKVKNDKLNKIKELRKKIDNIKFDEENIKENKIKELENLYENKVKEIKNELSSIYYPIYYIQQRKDEIEEFARKNNLDLEGYSFNLEGLSMKEIYDIMEAVTFGLDECLDGVKGNTSYLKVLYYPLLRKYVSEEQSIVWKLSYLCVMVTLIIVLSPILGAILYIILIVNSFNSIIKVEANKEFISIIYTIANKVEDFDKYIFSLIENDERLIEIDDLIYAAENIDINQIVEVKSQDIVREIKELEEDESVSTLMEELDNYRANEIPNIVSNLSYQWKELKDEISSKIINLDILIEKLKDIINSYPEIYENILSYHPNPYIDKQASDYISDNNIKDPLGIELKKKLKEEYKRVFLQAPPGIPISPEYTLSMKIKVSEIYDSDGRIYGCEYQEMYYNNTLVLYTEKKEESQLNLLKLIITNLLGNIKEDFIDLNIFDPERLGIDFSEFTFNRCNIITEKIEDGIKDLISSARKNQKILDGMIIQEYNSKAEEEGKVPLPYNIVVIKSLAGYRLFENITFMEFIKYSQNLGILVFLFAPTVATLVKANKIRSDDAHVYTNFYNKWANTIDPSGYLLNGDNEELELVCVKDKNIRPIQYEKSIGKRVIEQIAMTKEIRKADAIDYETKYRLRHLPEEKWWKDNTLKGIEIHPGFVDGNESNIAPVKVGVSGLPVHALMAAGTGMGKSVALNTCIINLCLQYSPEWLTLIMIDFKNVEFGQYSGKNTLPHCKVLAGTTDGEYALSIFEYLLEEMNNRKTMLGKYGFQNTKDWNESVLKGKIQEDILSSVLVICDEFQVMYSIDDTKIIDRINKLIRRLAKEARSMDMHLWFTSQSMEGTMSKDTMAQFKLRMALGIDNKDTAIDVLGNDAPYTEIRTRGVLIANADKGVYESNIEYRVPFLPNSHISVMAQKINERANSEYVDSRGIKHSKSIHHHAEFYDEKTMHNLTEVEDLYNMDQVKNEPVVFLGKPTYFTTNKLPVNFLLGQGPTENIAITGNTLTDLANLSNTIMKAVMAMTDKIRIVAYEPELLSVLNWDTIHKDKVFNCDMNNIVNSIEKLIEIRKNDANECADKIVFFLFNLDMAKGVGLSEDYKLVTRLTEIMQSAPIYNINIIIVGSNIKPIKKCIDFCQHKICALHDETQSFAILESGLAKNLPQDEQLSRCAYYRYKGIDKKIKIYNTDINVQKIKKKEIVL